MSSQLEATIPSIKVYQQILSQDNFQKEFIILRSAEEGQKVNLTVSLLIGGDLLLVLRWQLEETVLDWIGPRLLRLPRLTVKCLRLSLR